MHGKNQEVNDFKKMGRIEIGRNARLSHKVSMLRSSLTQQSEGNLYLHAYAELVVRL